VLASTVVLYSPTANLVTQTYDRFMTVSVSDWCGRYVQMDDNTFMLPNWLVACQVGHPRHWEFVAVRSDNIQY
jgi:hypothetical protein